MTPQGRHVAAAPVRLGVCFFLSALFTWTISDHTRWDDGKKSVDIGGNSIMTFSNVWARILLAVTCCIGAQVRKGEHGSSAEAPPDGKKRTA